MVQGEGFHKKALGDISDKDYTYSRFASIEDRWAIHISKSPLKMNDLYRVGKCFYRFSHSGIYIKKVQILDIETHPDFSIYILRDSEFKIKIYSDNKTEVLYEN